MNYKPVKITISNGYTFTIGNLGKLANIFSFELNKPNLTPTEIGAFQIIEQVTETDYPNLSVDELLSFDLNDFYDLDNACNLFNQQNGLPTPIGCNAIRLIHGVESDGVVYDLIVFEGTAKAIHQAEAERGKFSTNMSLAYLTSVEIVRLIQTKNGNTKNGSLSPAEMGELKIVDAVGLLSFALKRRQKKLTENSQPEIYDVLNSEVIN